MRRKARSISEREIAGPAAGRHRDSYAPAPAQRPKDAGTLLILDESGPVPRVLMGRRSSKLVFMPGKYVFPGGRLERSDLQQASRYSLAPAVRDRLLAETPAHHGERRAIGIALAALRETFEEVGLLLGTPGRLPLPSTGFEAFAAAGVIPDPEILVPVARAVTPPGHVRRFDTRFFCAPATAILSGGIDQRLDDEFEHVDWFSLDRLETLDLAGITRQVLADIDARLRDGSWRDTSLAMPFYRTRHGRPVREMI